MKLNFLELSENIAEGQRVENFIVQHRNEDKIWLNSFEGTTIGTKKIMKLHGLETDAVRILIVSSRDTPEINKIALYYKNDLRRNFYFFSRLAAASSRNIVTSSCC